VTAPAAAGALALADPPLTRAADPYWVYTDGLASEESRRAMRRCLDKVTRELLPRLGDQPDDPDTVNGINRAWWLLRYEHTAAARAALLQADMPPGTINQHLTALRRILKECWRLGYMNGDDYQRAADIKNVKGHREPAGRSIRGDEMAAMLHACLDDEVTLISLRDAALLALLHSTGLRRDEAATALVQRYDAVSRSLRVIGKGNKERTVYVHETASAYLDRWLVAYGRRTGLMFPALDKWGNIRPGPLSARAAGYIVNKRRVQACLPPLSTHDLRRTFAGDYLDAGGDLPQLQKLMGHADMTTTAGYDRRPGRQMQAIVDRLALPRPEDFDPQD